MKSQNTESSLVQNVTAELCEPELKSGLTRLEILNLRLKGEEMSDLRQKRKLNIAVWVVMASLLVYVVVSFIIAVQWSRPSKAAHPHTGNRQAYK